MKFILICLTMCAAIFGTALPRDAAAEISFGHIQLIRNEDNNLQWVGDVRIALNSHLRDALSKGGVTLYFACNFQVARPRWYWLDETVISRQQSFRLSYNALTQHYRLLSGDNSLAQNFNSLDVALRYLSQLSSWKIIGNKSSIKFGETYEARLRIFLDKSQLPRPFQLGALDDPNWTVDSGLYRWEFTPSFDD